LVAAALAGAVSGCSASLKLDAPEAGAPTCLGPIHGRPAELNGTLVLAAQSVQTASLVPCLRQLPAGWSFHSFDARRGQARLGLDLGLDLENAFVVTLTGECDVRSAPRVTSDRTGARRYDDVHGSARAYTGQRYYRFPGGCITMRFDIRGTSAEKAATTVAGSVGVVARPALRRYVELYSRGRFDLDPPQGR
jgi:hypothetical protein